MKCEICKNNIGKNFLGKLFGTVLKDEKGKKHNICQNCQKTSNSKQEMLKKLK